MAFVTETRTVTWRLVSEYLNMLSHKSRVYKTEINGSGDPLRWPRDTLYPEKLALTSPTIGGPSVGIVLLLTRDTKFIT
jgi:hypothetical protein